MNEEELKGKPLTKEETKALLDLVESSKAITTKRTNASTNKMKNEEWDRIARVFNSTTATRSRRTPKQLRLKWENLKKLARKRSGQIRLNNMKTGGGVAEYIPPDDILDRVSSLLGSTATGFDDIYGGDMVPQMSGGGGASIKGVGSGSDEEGAGVLGGGAEVIWPDDTALPATCSDAQQSVPSCSNAQTHSLDSQANALPNTPLKRTKFSPMMFTGKRRKVKVAEEDTLKTRNIAIADFYQKKKEYLEEKMKNKQLQNYKLQLEAKKLELEIEKLQLELNKNVEKVYGMDSECL